MKRDHEDDDRHIHRFASHVLSRQAPALWSQVTRWVTERAIALAQNRSRTSLFASLPQYPYRTTIRTESLYKQQSTLYCYVASLWHPLILSRKSSICLCPPPTCTSGSSGRQDFLRISFSLLTSLMIFFFMNDSHSHKTPHITKRRCPLLINSC